MLNENKLLLVVFFYLVLDIFAFSIILPWLPNILDSFENNPDVLHRGMKRIIRRLGFIFSIQSATKWDSVVMGGCITSAFSLCQCLSSTIIGTLSDIYSRRPLLITLQTLSIAAHLLIAKLGTSFVWFVCLRLLCGATRANVAVLTALVSDHSSTTSRSRAMAVIGAAYSVGFTLGPLFSALTVSRLVTRSQCDKLLECLGYGAALFNAIGLLFLCNKLPEATQKEHQRKSIDAHRGHLAESLKVSSLFSFNNLTTTTSGDTKLRKLGLFWFVYLLLFSGIEFTMLFLTRSRFGYTNQDQGRMFFFLGIIMTIVQGGLIRRFRVNQAQLGAVSILTLSAASLVLSGAWQQWSFHMGLLLFAVASATFVPSFQATASLLAKPDCQGHVLGLFRSLNALARSIGPAFLSLLFWSVGPTVCYALSGSALFLLCTTYVRTGFSSPQMSKHNID